MNKKYLFILLFSFSLQIKAQQIPNGDFEQWFYNSAIEAYEPVGWSTSNFGIYSDTGVYRYKPAQAGNFACGLKTNFLLGTYALPGNLTTTFPVNAVPDAMEGYFKGYLSTNDTALILIEFSQDSNIIADGMMMFTQSQNNYIKFIAPIDFFGSGTPDSCTISIYGGGYEIDDTLTNIALDNLSFKYPVSIKNTKLNHSDILQLYPNPATDLLNIRCKRNFQSIVVYNSSGQIIRTFKNESAISVSEFVTGLYFLTVVDENNQVIAGQSFIKH